MNKIKESITDLLKQIDVNYDESPNYLKITITFLFLGSYPMMGLWLSSAFNDFQSGVLSAAIHVLFILPALIITIANRKDLKHKTLCFDLTYFTLLGILISWIFVVHTYIKLPTMDINLYMVYLFSVAGVLIVCFGSGAFISNKLVKLFK